MTKLEARKHNMEAAKRLCEENKCLEEDRKEHFDKIVNRAWNPHPSQDFKNWWMTHPNHLEDGIDAVRARNCKCYCDEYKEAKQYGIT